MVDWIWPLFVLGQNSNLDWIFKSHSRSCSLPFPGIPVSHSRSQKSGRQFSFPFPFPNIGNAIFIPVPIPKSWECNFSFPFPFPKFGNGLSYSRSRSQSPKSHSCSPLPEIQALYIPPQKHLSFHTSVKNIFGPFFKANHPTIQRHVCQHFMTLMQCYNL